MKKTLLSTAVATAAIMLSQAAHADRVKGSARADFEQDELLVPCVVIDGYSDAADGQYFDIVLERRGKSFNYELTFAEPEDPGMCAEAANYAAFIDDDHDVADGDDDDEEDGDDGDDPVEVANLFASCEVRLQEGDQTRSKVKVKAKDLAAGEFYAVITSGENSLQSETRSIDEDEVEFEFSSSADDVDEGAEGIEPGFIEGESVTAALYDAAADAEPLLEETVSCRVKD